MCQSTADVQCSLPSQEAQLSQPCVPCPQLCSLLCHRWEHGAPAPHLPLLHIPACAQELHMQHCWAREISASNSQKLIRRPFPALLVYRKSVRALEVLGLFSPMPFSAMFPTISLQFTVPYWGLTVSISDVRTHSVTNTHQPDLKQKEQVFNTSNCFWIKLLILWTKSSDWSATQNDFSE